MSLEAWLTLALAYHHGYWGRYADGSLHIGPRTHPYHSDLIPGKIVTARWHRWQRQRKFAASLDTGELAALVGRIAEKVKAARDRKVAPPPTPCRALVVRGFWEFPIQLRSQLESARYRAGIVGGVA